MLRCHTPHLAVLQRRIWVACSEGMEAYTNAQIDHVNEANEQNEAQLNSNLEANRQVLLASCIIMRRFPLDGCVAAC